MKLDFVVYFKLYKSVHGFFCKFHVYLVTLDNSGNNMLLMDDINIQDSNTTCYCITCILTLSMPLDQSI